MPAFVPTEHAVRKTAFPPILGDDPNLLILGSMPGEVSLRANRYYAHPRNAFWPIMGALLGFGPDADYETRTAELRANRIALWDVMAECERVGSLDSGIRPASIRVNDFAALFRKCPQIRLVAFNGGTAQREYERQVLPMLSRNEIRVDRVRLPSTSPAYAAMSFDDKLLAWSVPVKRLAAAGTPGGGNSKAVPACFRDVPEYNRVY